MSSDPDTSLKPASRAAAADPQESAPTEPGTSFEGDYRPAQPDAGEPRPEARVEPVDVAFLTRLADTLSTTLDLQTMLQRTADLVRAVIDYRIFAILLLHEPTNELRMRLQLGHTADIERLRIPVGKGIVGQVAATRKPRLVADVRAEPNYINANPEVRSELAVPLIVKNRLIGVIDIQAEQPGYFRPEHLSLLTLTASRVAQAIENARLYTRVSRQAQTLALLNEVSREITSILDFDHLLSRIGELLHRVIHYQMFAILIYNERDQLLEMRYAQRFGNPSLPTQKIPLAAGLVGQAVRERRLINVADVRRDPHYVMVNPETRSEMVVPLLYKGTVIGVLDLEHTRTGYFNEDHERTITTLAAQIAIAIENARLYQALARQEQRLERDLAMAREVQLRLLPPRQPVRQHAEFAARFLPARTIGGDLYDFLEYDPQRIAIAMGDVSGKAAPAALYAALVSGIMRSAATRAPGPADMLALLNSSLQERRLDSQYVTMLYSVWNDETRTLQLANAGSVQPIFCRGGEVDVVRAEGFPLGLFPGSAYEEFSLSTQPGDSILFFSDGLVDAENRVGEMYGSARLIDSVARHQHRNATQLADAVLQDIARFQNGHDRFDDETLVVLRAL